MKIPPILQPAQPGERPEIIYPCAWTYTVIGEDQQHLHQAIVAACSPQEVLVSPSRRSSKGRYVSVNAELVVPDEAVRLAIYERLKMSAAVKLVL